MRYSAKPRHSIFVNFYGFLSFSKYKGKNIVENISKTSK